MTADRFFHNLYMKMYVIEGLVSIALDFADKPPEMNETDAKAHYEIRKLLLKVHEKISQAIIRNEERKE